MAPESGYSNQRRPRPCEARANLSRHTMKTLANILETGCAAGDGHIAIDSWDRALSFSELDQRSNAVAAALLRDFHLKRGERVAIVADKSVALVVAAVGIWKAGAIYMPVDINNSPGRTRTILDSTAPGVVISSERILKRDQAVLGNAPHLSYEALLQLEPEALAAADRPDVTPGDIATIIHTSGSTGAPKGAMLSHGSMVEYFKNHNGHLRFNSDTCGMNNGPFHFDVSIQDTFLPLSFGSRVVFHQGSFIGPLLMKTIRQKRVTHLVVMSSVLNVISQEPEYINDLRESALRCLVTGGELCDPKLINTWKLAIPDLRILYGYGPTECNSLCMNHEITAADLERTKPYPIGRPFSGVSAVLLDSEGHEIEAANVPGVLAIGGAQLMSGYWGRTDLTAKVMKTINGATYYVTGDHCYRDDTGDYHFVGRADTEVKIRGHRIDLNEIRYTILSEPSVRYAQVGTVEVNEHSHIYVFAHGVGGKQLLHQDLLNSLRRKLPPYMLPTYIKISKDLELTTTNKVNERVIDAEMRRTIGEHPDVRFIA